MSQVFNLIFKLLFEHYLQNSVGFKGFRVAKHVPLEVPDADIQAAPDLFPAPNTDIPFPEVEVEVQLNEETVNDLTQNIPDNSNEEVQSDEEFDGGTGLDYNSGSDNNNGKL